METQGTPFGAVLSILGAICAFVLVLVLAWLATRFLAGRYAAQGPRNGSVEILERTALGTDRSLVIVRVGGKVWLLGVTAHHINTLCELDPSEVSGTGVPAGTGSFSSALSDALGNFGIGKKQEKEKQDE